MNYSSSAARVLNSFSPLPSQKAKKYNEAYSLYQQAKQAHVQAEEWIQAAETETQLANLALKGRKVGLNGFSFPGSSSSDPNNLIIQAVRHYMLSCDYYIKAAEYELAYESLKLAIESRGHNSSLYLSAEDRGGHNKLAIPHIQQQKAEKGNKVVNKFKQFIGLSPKPKLNIARLQSAPPQSSSEDGLFSNLNNLFSRSTSTSIAHTTSRNSAGNSNIASSPINVSPSPTSSNGVASANSTTEYMHRSSSYNCDTSSGYELSLELAHLCYFLGEELWNNLHYAAALEALETALTHYQVLTQPNCKDYYLGQNDYSSRLVQEFYSYFSERINCIVLLADCYVDYEDFMAGNSDTATGHASILCDTQVLHRAKELYEDSAHEATLFNQIIAEYLNKSQLSSPATSDSSPLANYLAEVTSLPQPIAAVIGDYCFRPAHACLFLSGLCDLRVLAANQQFLGRVLTTPTSLVRFINAFPDFLQHSSCKYLRQLYGLVHLSTSAPARLLEGGIGLGPEDAYKRILLSMWGADIYNEFNILFEYFQQQAQHVCHNIDDRVIKVLSKIQKLIKNNITNPGGQVINKR
jgi:hypothetical protein